MRSPARDMDRSERMGVECVACVCCAIIRQVGKVNGALPVGRGKSY